MKNLMIFLSGCVVGAGVVFLYVYWAITENLVNTLEARAYKSEGKDKGLFHPGRWG